MGPLLIPFCYFLYNSFCLFVCIISQCIHIAFSVCILGDQCALSTLIAKSFILIVLLVLDCVGAAQSGSPTQDGQGEKVVKYSLQVVALSKLKLKV